MSIENKLQIILNNIDIENEIVASQEALIEEISVALEGKTGISGYDVGFEAGKQACLDTIWDGIQNGGERVDYPKAFGKYWNAETFKPKYDMVPTSAAQMFDRFGGEVITDAPPVDLAGILEQAGVKLDTSKVPNFANFFYYSSIGHSPEISVIGSKNALVGVFAQCRKLTKIDKLILKVDGTDVFNNTFQNTFVLTDIMIEGVIGNSIDFAQSPLSKASIESVLNALSDTSTGKTATFAKHAVDTAFETSTDLNDGSSSTEWLKLTQEDHSNWSFSLV